jgi:hypothetical protein
MSLDRRIGLGHAGPDRVVIDDVLFERKVGRHARTCACCEATIAPGEERYIPIRHDERRRLVDGRHTRICLPCVERRLERAKGAA